MSSIDNRDSLSNHGSVEDIKCSLGYINPDEAASRKKHIAYLERSLICEKQDKKRDTVIKMIEVKLRKLYARI